MSVYIVATVKSWNVDLFIEKTPYMSGKWHLVNTQKELQISSLKKINPRYIFFPHWSQKIPAEIYNNYECVCFHMTDLPYGRGGSPLQNLIVRGHTDTKLTALRMEEEMDAGPVYMKRDLSLSGRADDILKRAAALSFDMMSEIIMDEIEPVAQKGEVVEFERRSPDQSDISGLDNPKKIYDYVRMLDGEGYPSAFVETRHFRIEFDGAELDGSKVSARATIKLKT